MSNYSTKTAHFDLIESSRWWRLPWQPMDFSTLNEKFTIEDGALPDSGKYPELGYLVIGNGGHRAAVNTGNVAAFDVLQHRATDAALFNHIPFIVRPKNQDLEPGERARYRLRRLEEHGGNEYWVYYMRKILVSSQSPSLDVLTTNNGVTNTDPYQPVSSQLNPSPVVLPAGQVIESTGQKIRTRVPVNVELNQTEINEIIDAVTVIYGDANKAIISEIGVCTGVDANVVADTVSYTEVIAAQIANFVGEVNILSRNMSRLTLSYDIGNSIPYLV